MTPEQARGLANYFEGLARLMTRTMKVGPKAVKAIGRVP